VCPPVSSSTPPVCPPVSSSSQTNDILSTAMMDSGISSDAASDDEVFASVEDWLKNLLH
jgi:hypothetical protein